MAAELLHHATTPVLPAATVRTAVQVPLRFADGYATTASVRTFPDLVDGQEHLLLGLGDWQGALRRTALGGEATQPRSRSGLAGRRHDTTPR